METKKNKIPIDITDHFITGEIDGDKVESAIKWIVSANKQEEAKTLTLHLNSEGGALADAFALIDWIQSSKIPVATLGAGSIMSAAFLIFASGAKGGRGIAKNTSIMGHQFSHEYTGKYHDVKSYTSELERFNERMINVISGATKLDNAFLKKNLFKPTDVWLEAKDLIKLEIADYIF